MAETVGDSEAMFLVRIADAIRGTDLGLKSIGQDDTGVFSVIAVQEPAGIYVAFTHQSPVTVADAFVEYCETRKAGS